MLLVCVWRERVCFSASPKPSLSGSLPDFRTSNRLQYTALWADGPSSPNEAQCSATPGLPIRAH
ncbi:uncharacterized protein MYCGRDRAFT_103884 [Zymoseptoria tritici IPO323]|uniref:Uncharacterized protein n=1 Tax=Zymoseptoria tritici (strain CBS 115943 / IPO323) TaxID=336722 RepID=F9X5A8_ZYMTI|nr:uncharacterized protein MYCGRDRAFT_103884 [Zymoseptoria tritici IPO323]EGP88994.1 hypothetical protein MYCGRDRAFT_103884 [Zymoseptoria tritici IPO323]